MAGGCGAQWVASAGGPPAAAAAAAAACARRRRAGTARAASLSLRRQPRAPRRGRCAAAAASRPNPTSPRLQQTIQLTKRRAPGRPPAAPVRPAPQRARGRRRPRRLRLHPRGGRDAAREHIAGRGGLRGARGGATTRREKGWMWARHSPKTHVRAKRGTPMRPPCRALPRDCGDRGGGGVRAPEAPKAAAAAARAALGAPGAAGGRRVLQGLQTALPRRAPPACSKRCTQQPCAWQAALACRAAPACLSTLRLTRTAFRTRAIPHRARSARTPATTRARRMCTRTAATRPRATASAR